MTDPISNFITQIKNGYLASKKTIEVPTSKLKENLAQVLSKAGYVGKVTTKDTDEARKVLVVELLYKDKMKNLTDIKRVSKPGKRVYVSKNKIGQVLGGIGCKIISTPLGLMTDKDARKKGVGGEIICKLW